MDSCETLQFYAGAGAKDYVLPGDGGNAVQEPIKIFKGAIKIFVVVLVVEPERKIMFYQETDASCPGTNQNL